MKTPEELNALKEEVETLNIKLHELTDKELEEVVGGMKMVYNDDNPDEFSWWEKVLKILLKY